MLPVILSRYMDVRQHLKYMQEFIRVHTGINTFDSAITRRNLQFQASFLQMNKPILYFEQLSILRLLYANNTEKAIAEFIAEILKRNSRCRFPQGEELLHTLEVYFAVNGKTKEEWQRRYIHYNTVPPG